jgi:hypothetical protein
MSAIRSALPMPPKRTFPYALWLAGLGGWLPVRFSRAASGSGHSLEQRRRERVQAAVGRPVLPAMKIWAL